jgi:hypothetical protein
MAKRPNYGQERAERQRKKAARRDERLAARASRRHEDTPSVEDAEAAQLTAAEPTADATSHFAANDPIAMASLAHALKFVCGAEHPTTLAAQQAARSGGHEDIGRARALFLQLTPRNQRAALTIAAAAPAVR